jgi:hypothetical protein
LGVLDGAEHVVEHHQVAAFGELADLGCGIFWQQPCDQRGYVAHCPVAALGVGEVPFPSFHVGVDDQCRQWLAVLTEDGTQCCWPVLLHDLGGVLGADCSFGVRGRRMP